jgi:DHA1 family inner membrane transport protein
MVTPPAATGPVARLLLHFGLFTLASAMSGVFSAAFLLRAGLSPALVFLALGALLALRFAFRPLMLWLAPRIGARRTLMAGTIVSAAQYPLLAEVHGLDATLLLYTLVAAVGEALYWVPFHTCFATWGTADKFGRLASLRQIAGTLAGIAGPPVGGFLLMHDPLAAFAASTVLRLVAALPLWGLDAVPVARRPPPNAWRQARFGFLVFVTDGWILCSAGTAWSLIAFLALDRRFDALGAAMAAAALVGAGATWLLGRHVDLGHGWRVVLINLAASLAVLAMQATAGFEPLRVLAAMLAGAVLGGFAVPAIMTAVYTEARDASCTLRFQFAAEGGWDLGGTLVSLACAAILSLGAPLQAALVVAMPGLFVQVWLMRGVYERRRPAEAAAG